MLPTSLSAQSSLIDFDPRLKLLQEKFTIECQRKSAAGDCQGNLRKLGLRFFRAIKCRVGSYDCGPITCIRDRKKCETTPDTLRDSFGFFVEGRTAGPTPAKALPSVVMIESAATKLHCTGVLVDRQTVVSALHCLCPAHAGGRLMPVQSVAYQPETKSTKTVRSAVSAAVIPPGSRCPWQPGMPDIVLLRLAKPLGAPAAPAVFARPEWRHVPDYFLIAGYGRSNEGELGVLNHARVAPLSRQCFDRNQRLPLGPNRYITGDTRQYRCIAPTEVIAVGTERKRNVRTDTCDGDSGGPLFFFSGNLAANASKHWDVATLPAANDARVFVAALTSRAVDPRGRDSCGAGGIYTWIDQWLIDWMRAAGAEPQVATKKGPPIDRKTDPWEPRLSQKTP